MRYGKNAKAKKAKAILVYRSLVITFYSMRILATDLIDSNSLIMSLLLGRLMLAVTTFYKIVFSKKYCAFW